MESVAGTPSEWKRFAFSLIIESAAINSPGYQRDQEETCHQPQVFEEMSQLHLALGALFTPKRMPNDGRWDEDDQKNPGCYWRLDTQCQAEDPR